VNQMDWGIHLGAGYRRRILKKSVLFDFRLFLGFSDIFFVPGSGDNKYFRMQKTKITGAYVTIGYEL